MATFGRRVGSVDEGTANTAVSSLEARMRETDDRGTTPAAPAAAPSKAPVSTPAPAKAKATRAKKELPDIDFGSVVVGSPTDDTVRALKPVKGTRTAQQEQTDNLVKAAHSKWVAAGRDMKCTFNVQHKDALSHLRVAAEHRDALKYRLQQSATFLQYRIRFGKDDPNYPGDILFYVTDRPAKKEPKKTATEGQTSV